MSLRHGFPHHGPAAISVSLGSNGGGGPLSTEPLGVRRVLNTLLALLAIAVVMLAHGVAKLVLLPFRALRGLFRHSSKRARVTAA